MNPCKNHPEHAAIEHCEVCGEALCDLCLWYDDDGRRLCERHAREYEAQGGEIQSPALYGEAIHVQEIDETSPLVKAPYMGNDNDLSALVAVVLGAAAISSWFGGVYCLPIIAGIVGLVGLSSASRSINPKRTRNLSLIGIGLSLLSVVPFILFFCFFSFAITMSISGFNFGP